MKVTVLGTGCYKCLDLERLLGEVLAESDRGDVSVERVSDERFIRRFMPIDTIPGLVIDGRLMHSGSVPSKQELQQWLAKATNH